MSRHRHAPDSPADYFARPFENEERKEQDMTPKSFQDHWRFTPSLMDPTSFAFSAFANQPPGYYTPTPGGFTTVYHNQAGDLHTPGMGLNTPLSLPHSIHTLHEADPTMHGHNFNPHFLHHPPPFHDPFAPLAQPPPQQMQQPFAAAHFLQHQDSGYAGMGESSHQTTPTQSEMPMGSSTLHNHAPHAFIRGVVARPKDLSQGGEKYVRCARRPRFDSSGLRFRYHTTLNAPTAMIRHADEIPITYLNKGQAYTMSIYDTAPPLPQARAVLKYRTYVRVSFEDEQQRARPRACWQLWKEGRGSNEAHQRGGKLLAVEYVDPNQGGDDELRKSHIQLEKASFDGFAVTWYPNPAGRGPDCSISVRFNFLSTDFSHSKGVKGIPVRLCAKTELLTPQTSASNDAEVCFSKVKLFRDHGAERKLSNDVAHVRKSIDKLKQQIAQAEAGIGNGSKRKRSGSMAKTGSTSGKPIGHKRTWSMDSNAEPGKLPAEEDLQMKLVSMQDMFSSTRPVSTLFLRGDPEDDPDLHPVALAGGNDVVDMKAMAQTATSESRPSASDSPTSNAVSPTASSGSRTTPKRKLSPEVPPTGMLQGPANESYSDWDAPARPVKITKLENGSGVMSSLFVVDVDGNYRPPAERPIKPGESVWHFLLLYQICADGMPTSGMLLCAAERRRQRILPRHLLDATDGQGFNRCHFGQISRRAVSSRAGDTHQFPRSPNHRGRGRRARAP